MSRKIPVGNRDANAYSHVISAMPLRVDYAAYVLSTYQREDRDGETYFVHRYKRTEVGVPFQELEDRDAFELRDAFLAVTTPVEALHFLRGSGDFTRSTVAVSWTEFQLWQKLTRFVHVASDRESLSRAEEPDGGLATSDRELVRLIRAAEHWPDRSLSHNYFGKRSADGISPSFLASLTRMAKNETDSNEAASVRLGRLLEQVDAAAHDAEGEQRALEARFVRPLPGSYEIRWNNEDAPELTFPARNTLEAIAATIHIDRMAGRRYTRCEKNGCGKIILVGSQGSKRFCNRQHMDAARKKEKWDAAKRIDLDRSSENESRPDHTAKAASPRPGRKKPASAK